jgi:hypothetical protein
MTLELKQAIDLAKSLSMGEKLELLKILATRIQKTHSLGHQYTEAEYATLVELLDRLIDQVGEDESHPLASMMDVIGVLIENYETEHVPELVG